MEFVIDVEYWLNSAKFHDKRTRERQNYSWNRFHEFIKIAHKSTVEYAGLRISIQ